MKTRLSGLFVAVLLVATMLFLTPLFDGLPQATLAAIIIAAVIGLVDVKGFRRLWQIDQGRREARDRRVRRRCPPRRPAGNRDRRRRLAPGADPACLPAPDRRARSRDRRDERRRGLPVPRHRPPPGVRDDSRPRPASVLERALLRQRRRTSATRRSGSWPRPIPPARTVLVDASAISHVDTTARRDARGPDRPPRRPGYHLRARARPRTLEETLKRTGLDERIGPEQRHRSVHAGVQAFLARPASLRARCRSPA